MDQRRGRTAAALAALALMLGLSTTSYADVIAGLILDPSSEGTSSSQDVSGTFGEGSESGAGVVISDQSLRNGDGGSASYSGNVNIVTKGQNGGAGVVVRSYSDPVTATVSGSVTNRDESENGALTPSSNSSAGIAALSYYAGKVNLTSSANVDVTGTTAGPNPDNAAAATGVLLHARDSDDLSYTHFYLDDDGVQIPIQIDNRDGASHFTISEESAWKGDVWNEEPIEDLFIIFCPDETDKNASVDFYLIKNDGTIVGKSQEPLSVKAYHWFYGTDIDNPDPDPTHITDKTITVTLQSDSDENGVELTITQTDEGGSLLGGYDAYYKRFIVLGSQTMEFRDVKAGDHIAFVSENKSEYEIVKGKLDSTAIEINADLTGTITAQTADRAPEAIGLYAYPLSGMINANMHDLSIKASAQRPLGIYGTGTGVNTIIGKDNVVIDVTGTGDTPGPTGILFMNAPVVSRDSVLSITGSGNSLNVQTEGPSSENNVKQLTSGIRTNTMSPKTQIANLVRFEGPVTVTDSHPEGAAYGIYSQAMFHGKSVIEVIGDITVSATAGAGAYAQNNKQVLNPLLPAYNTEVIEYVRGNIIFNNAGDRARGIRSHGGTVVLDGDIKMSGSGTKMIGIYAETYSNRGGKPALVYVYDTIDAPYACRLLPDSGADSTESTVYLWDYTQEFTTPNPNTRNVSERVGSVIKYDEALGELTLSSDNEGFVKLESNELTHVNNESDEQAYTEENRIYYGALEGNTVTVSGCDPTVYFEVQDARGNVLEIQDPAESHTFVVPKTFEDGEAEQLGIYLTAHKHDWTETTYEWSDDDSTVTASHVCKIDESHNETETAKVVRKVIDPTCTEKGKTTLTAKFENKSFETQVKTMNPVNALGHEWGDPTYTWAKDNSTVTATRVCARDSSHVETETVKVVRKVTEPTCTKKGTARLAVNFKNEAFAAQTKTIDAGEALGHEWGEPTYTWEIDENGNVTVTAVHSCSHDTDHEETETVTATVETTEEGTKVYKANFENFAFETQKKTEEELAEEEEKPTTKPTTPTTKPTTKPTTTVAQKPATQTAATRLAKTGDRTNHQLIAMLAGVGFSLTVAGFMARRKHAH